MRLLSLLPLLAVTACATLADEQRARVAAYKADESRLFVTRLASTKIDPKAADLAATVTAGAIDATLAQLDRSVFPAGSWEFAPTRPPQVELATGSALLRVTGEVRKKGEPKSAEVEIVAGLAARWNEDGSHLFLKPTALAVVPTTGIGLFDFALGAAVRSFAEGKAAEYLAERVGEIDLPVQLMLPFRRPALDLSKRLRTDGENGPVLGYQLPEASAQLKLQQLYLWLLEGRIVVLAYADVVRVESVVPDHAAAGVTP